MLTESQLAAREEKEARGETETEHPGYLGAQDTYTKVAFCSTTGRTRSRRRTRLTRRRSRSSTRAASRFCGCLRTGAANTAETGSTTNTRCILTLRTSSIQGRRLDPRRPTGYASGSTRRARTSSTRWRSAGRFTEASMRCSLTWTSGWRSITTRGRIRASTATARRRRGRSWIRSRWPEKSFLGATNLTDRAREFPRVSDQVLAITFLSSTDFGIADAASPSD